MTRPEAAVLLALPDQHRGELASFDGAVTFWTAPWYTIATIELVPGHPISEMKWVIPHQWASAGQFQGLSRRTIDFEKVLPAGWESNDEAYVSAVRRLKRLAALLFTETLQLNVQHRGPPQPSTWVRMIQRLISAGREALLSAPLIVGRSTCPDGASIFAHLSPEEIRSIFVAEADALASVIPRLNGLFLAGSIDDWPAADVRVIDGRPRAVWQPFNDSFVALAGDAAFWVVEVLGPDILAGWSKMRAMRSLREATSNPRVASDRRREAARLWAQDMEDRGVSLRYHFRISASENGRKSSILSHWGQVVPGAIDDLAITLQEAHAWIISLAAAPRNGEIVTFPRDCLVPTSDGHLLRGYTFKLSESEEVRDWPLPKAAVHAVQQQQKLAAIIDPDGDRLFVSFKLGKNRRAERDKLKFRADVFPTRVLLNDGVELKAFCSGNVHSHRFRKTVSRLAALSLVGASEILFDILGHRDPQMTLSYILSDPELQSEMRTIATEAAMMMTEQAASEAVELGGPAAASVRELVGRFQPQSAEQELDETSLATVAKLLSQNGRVTMVKRNVLCTKTINQAGPCNRRIGNPDIGNCQVGCLHRLELAAARRDHELAITRATEEFFKADGMMKAFWQGQLVSHLLPFPDLARKELLNERVREALVGVPLEEMLSLAADELGAAQ